MVISSGYFIGEIVDSLATIQQQVKNRCAVGLTDMNVHAESFFNTILNHALGTSMVNLNTERSNAPGLDLADPLAGVGFQVTSQSDARKINDTLKAVDGLDERPENIYVLIIGKRQSKYALDAALCEKLGFDESHIWDITTVCRELLGLEIEGLKEVYDYIRKETIPLKIELEIPDPNGDYPTAVSDYMESIPRPVITDFSRYCDYFVSIEPGYANSVDQMKTDLTKFIDELKRLPRVTREFYSLLLEHRDDDQAPGDYNIVVNFNRFKRICQYPYMQEEITLLEEHGLVNMNQPDDYDQSPYVTIRPRGQERYLVVELIDFIEANDIGYRRPLVSLDFSAFGIRERRVDGQALE